VTVAENADHNVCVCCCRQVRDGPWRRQTSPVVLAGTAVKVRRTIHQEEWRLWTPLEQNQLFSRLTIL